MLDRKSGYDLRDSERYADKFAWADRIWFLAWDIGAWKKAQAPTYEADILESNLALCRSVFRSIEKAGKPFLFVSSQAALSPEPTTLGVTKRVGELWTRILGGRIARLWNVYGWEPVGEKSHLIPDLVWQGLAGNIRLMTSGDETRQFLHVYDCVEALLHQFDSSQKEADITSGEWVSVKDVAVAIGDKLHVKVDFGQSPGRPSPAQPSILLNDWRPKIIMDNGLDNVIAEARTWAIKNH